MNHSHSHSHAHGHHHHHGHHDENSINGAARRPNNETTPLIPSKSPFASSTTSTVSSSARRQYSGMRESMAFFLEEGDTPLTTQKLHQVAHDIHEYGVLKERLNWFLLYIMTVLLYIGLNGALLVANSFHQEFIEEHYEASMHYFSFWGVFLFTVVEATLLIATSVVRHDNKLQSALVLFDVCFSFFSATLYSMDPETFEVPAHYAEYIVQIPITCVNLIFVKETFAQREQMDANEVDYEVNDDENNNQVEPRSSTGTGLFEIVETVFSYGVVGLSFLQLVLYANLIPLGMSHERAAHFCEFIIELVNGSFALKYAISCYVEWKQQLDMHTI